MPQSSFSLTARLPFSTKGAVPGVRRTTRFTTAAAIAAIAAGGCVDGFRGSNVQIDLSPATPVQAPVAAMGGPTDLPVNSHFTLYAIQEDPAQDRLFEVQRFEIHRIVDPRSPCFIDVGEHVRIPGLHVTQFATKIEQDTGITDLANPPAGATEQQKIAGGDRARSAWRTWPRSAARWGSRW